MTKTNRNLHSLVYSSLATPGFNSEEIESLLLNARCYNEQQDITGLLLFHEGAFLQVLEGDRRTISHLFEKKLMRDPRHSAVTLFHDEQINQRALSVYCLFFCFGQIYAPNQLLGSRQKKNASSRSWFYLQAKSARLENKCAGITTRNFLCRPKKCSRGHY